MRLGRCWFSVFVMLMSMSACSTLQRSSTKVNSLNSGKADSVIKVVEIVKDTIYKTDTVFVPTMPTVANIQFDTVDYDIAIKDKLEDHRQEGVYRSADWIQSPHFNLRKPNYVIIHHTFQDSIEQTIRTFQIPRTKVSSHYVIGKDGRVVQMLNDFDRAWHAGNSRWGSVTDINSSSIGIELDNNGFDDFPDEQIMSLMLLLDKLKSKYYIPRLNFIGHADIAPTRKNDPHVKFPWKLLAEKGFGIWYDENNLVEPPSSFNPIDAMKIMGYDMRKPKSAIEAFKRKFIVSEINDELTDYDKKVLYNLYLKYY